MNKFKSKKGFTLAELLIVVAIIAILVAIAVPLFVGSLSKAQEARDNANIRAVRGAAVVYLLENTDKTGEGGVWNGATADGFAGWNVTATVTASGEIKNMKIEVGAVDTTKFLAAGKVAPAADKSEKGGFDITLHIDNTEVTANKS